MLPVAADVSLTTADGEMFDGPLGVRRLQLTERLDRPFELVLEVVTDLLDLDVGALLGARGSVPLVRPDHTLRIVHGVVTRAEYLATRRRQLSARLVLESPLALLRYSRGRRIFADQTLPEVLERVAGPVFEQHGGAWRFDRLRGALEPRDYVVQYDETDLDFVLRLLSEAGWCLTSADGGDHEVLAPIDSSTGLPGLGTSPLRAERSEPALVPLISAREEEATTESVQYLGRAHAMRTRATTVIARDWKTEAGTTFHTELDDGVGRGRRGRARVYHPGRLDEGKGSNGSHRDGTDAWVYRRGEEHVAQGVYVHGASNLSAASAGATFELTQHPHTDLDEGYAMLHVVHRADFPQVEVGAPAEARATYHNTFVAQQLEDDVAVRPPLRSRPVVMGPETAVVVGPPGQEIHTDVLGRVRVRFHWDVGEHAEARTCWLRVAQTWAGPGFGALFVPRVGMEVVVSFLGGDPDRPIVTGCVYTGSHPPPGCLPETKTHTTLRTRSTPGGEGFNELRFDDAAGHEEVFLHAQRNHREQVRAGQQVSVGGSRSLRVGGESTRTIGGGETVQIGVPNGEGPGDLTTHVTGSELRMIGDVHALDTRSAHWTADEALVAHADEAMWLSCASGGSALTVRPRGGALVELLPPSVTIEAPQSITLQVGSAKLQLTPRGIFMEGAVVTADVTEQLHLRSKAGTLVLNQEGTQVIGGPQYQSELSLTATEARLHSGAATVVEGRSVALQAHERVGLEAETVEIEARNAASVKAMGQLDLFAAEDAVLRGAMVRIN